MPTSNPEGHARARLRKLSPAGFGVGRPDIHRGVVGVGDVEDLEVQVTQPGEPLIAVTSAARA